MPPLHRVATDVGGGFPDLACLTVDPVTGATLPTTAKTDTSRPRLNRAFSTCWPTQWLR